MNRQHVVQSQPANGFSRRTTDKETGTRVDSMLVTGKIVSSMLAGDSEGGSGSPSHERLVYLATCLIGHPVEVQVIDGSVFSGIFHATNGDTNFGIILKMARLMKAGSSRGQLDILDSVNKPPSKTLIIPARELVQVMAKGVSVTRDGLANEIQHVKQQEIMTDSNISQSRHVEVERELGRWVPDDDDRECPELDNIFDGPWNRGWDQFEANEALFGVKSTFDEDLYTTKLDRGPQMRELEIEALRIAREIEGEDTQDLHLAEERGLKLQKDYEMDEEARFSSVLRGVDDSGFDEKENLLDIHNSETFGNVSGFVGKSFSDFPSGRSIGAAQLPSSSTMGLVESSYSISGSEYLPVSDKDNFSFDRGSRFEEFGFSDELTDHIKDESEMPNLAEEGQASEANYSHPSTRLKRASSDKVGLSPNAAAYAPTSATPGKNFSSNSSENLPSAKQRETTQSVLTRARPGSSTSSTSDFGNAIPASAITGLSPSSSVGSLASERSTLNPHAKEFKFNPNAKSFSPTKTSFRPASPVSDGSLYYSTNVPNVPHMHGLPVSMGMGPSFSSHQPVMFNHQSLPMQSPQTYYHPNGPQYGQQMLLSQPRQVLYMPTYPPEMQFKGREF
ncbi:polyadenylate-binding protein-interacting protein 4 [Daucus carota subsp. sativus]|uniref:polyadenylate-binding protein-interacting protein 4 n=1 Tax=Daucus carota subsp. sativus TaxID=79200 RepID=UPI0007EF24F6|nr:PREDICTED: polyadenylate-binding protein-interacting protein 4-like isoform X1 [Daucus carota subsp. sativus]XP_017252861.1 PREDICTED: polyadenylate-binding protein-interacting protein 4-like isoform X1 [Daucus carota subsp. sativus]XP_017252862.1 PREDICTED: polyadenylate-binding protein-interacting protein 4-like isoform X1 [Daucus carota subsp. sativus]XP_017252863.1 PREDICTED: polyadenylate-binding protein-interacting protein 4-like isoform X2 [Daucus carota subsp. sativus]